MLFSQVCSKMIEIPIMAREKEPTLDNLDINQNEITNLMSLQASNFDK